MSREERIIKKNDLFLCTYTEPDELNLAPMIMLPPGASLENLDPTLADAIKAAQGPEERIRIDTPVWFTMINQASRDTFFTSPILAVMVRAMVSAIQTDLEMGERRVDFSIHLCASEPGSRVVEALQKDGFEKDKVFTHDLWRGEHDSFMFQQFTRNSRAYQIFSATEFQKGDENYERTLQMLREGKALGRSGVKRGKLVDAIDGCVQALERGVVSESDLDRLLPEKFTFGTEHGRGRR